MLPYRFCCLLNLCALFSCISKEKVLPVAVSISSAASIQENRYLRNCLDFP